jgi:hypothetical protein
MVVKSQSLSHILRLFLAAETFIEAFQSDRNTTESLSHY